MIELIIQILILFALIFFMVGVYQYFEMQSNRKPGKSIFIKYLGGYLPNLLYEKGRKHRGYYHLCMLGFLGCALLAICISEIWGINA